MSNVYEELFAGATAGLMADAIMHPVDTVRTHVMMETQTEMKHNNTMLKQGRLLWGRAGLRGFYRGVGMVAAISVPSHAAYFAGYEWAKRRLLDGTASDGKAGGAAASSAHFGAGVFAELCGALFWTPMDVIKQRVQYQSGSSSTSYSNSLAACRTVFRDHGLPGFFRGFWVGVATYAPYVGLYFAVYERAKLEMGRWWYQDDWHRHSQAEADVLPMPLLLVCGTVAGSVAAAVTTPLDVLKTRVQTSSAGRSATQELRLLVKHEGWRALAQGTSARVLWLAPGAALTIAFYDTIKHYSIVYYKKQQ